MNRVSENGELLRYFKRGARYNRSDVPVGARLRLYLVNIIVKLQNLVLALFNWLLYEKNRSPRSILIFRTGSLGDSLCAVPAIRCIAAQYPEATIDILTNAGRKNLAGMAHLLDKNLYREVIDYFGMPKKELFGFLRKRIMILSYNCHRQTPVFFPATQPGSFQGNCHFGLGLAEKSS